MINTEAVPESQPMQVDQAAEPAEQPPGNQEELQEQVDRLNEIKMKLNEHVELFLGAINDIYVMTG